MIAMLEALLFFGAALFAILVIALMFRDYAPRMRSALFGTTQPCLPPTCRVRSARLASTVVLRSPSRARAAA